MHYSIVAVDEDINPEDFTMILYASKYFNVHPKNTGGSTAGRKALGNKVGLEGVSGVREV